MRTKRLRTSCLAAFTLIELLVVVAIIAVLISILMPSLAMARKQAKQLQCLTHLRVQGHAAYYYAESNKDYLIGGVENIPDENIPEYINYPASLLISGGLAWKGWQKGIDLWKQKKMFYKIAKDIPQFNCPTHPNEKSHFDYVSSAIPIPYTQKNYDHDADGGGNRGKGYRPENADSTDYRMAFRISEIERHGAMRLIYVTDSHVSLGHADTRFHTFFLASQLPFGAYPRIASDLRHTGGLNALFFDGSARTVSMQQFDVGWPNRIGLRLRYLTTLPGPLSRSD